MRAELVLVEATGSVLKSKRIACHRPRATREDPEGTEYLGETPSLIGSTLRCDVPQLRKPHSATRRFCVNCFARVLKQTRADLDKLEAL